MWTITRLRKHHCQDKTRITIHRLTTFGGFDMQEKSRKPIVCEQQIQTGTRSSLSAQRTIQYKTIHSLSITAPSQKNQTKQNPSKKIIMPKYSNIKIQQH